ncbi:Clavaminate synthase-like protein [Hesseltinella vesiculosa]|uniref:Clavaminate synthase-like protein n=1 Tax=Hesseltinella vesiculosa TaxID=101127 RepID=A0A1X2GNI9_9FUNG|nr:Clavaminate synthase-like protein [Hesseltinella vesiculosa]
MSHSLPKLDFSQYQPDNPEKKETTEAFLKSLYETMHDIGFFYITGHGIPLAWQNEALACSKSFFALPTDIKSKVAMAQSPHYRGYTKLNGETTDYKQDNRETFDISKEYPTPPPGAPGYQYMRGPNQWPAELPGFKPVIMRLLVAMQQVGLRLLRAMAQSLKIDEDDFMAMFGDDLGMRMKLTYYPGQTNVKDKPLEHGLGVGPHKDYGFLALLLQDQVGGLQVQRLSDGEWLDASPIEDTFVVNIGEIFERLTRRRFIATVHRVLTNGKHDRYSIPLFLAPHNQCKVPQLDRFFPLENDKRGQVADVKEDQLLQGEVYGENEFKGYRRSHVAVTNKWFFYDDTRANWFLRPASITQHSIIS